MKIVLFLLFLGGIFITNLTAQEKNCEYEVINDSLCFVKTKDLLIHKKETDSISSSVFFSLISKDENPFLHFQFLQKSQDILSASCVNHKSIIALKLQNGRIINTYYIGDEKCSSNAKDDDSQQNIYILTTHFVIRKEDLSYLKESPVTTIQIRFSNKTEQITFPKEPDSEITDKMTLPAYFFIRQIPCIEENRYVTEAETEYI